MQIDVNDLEIGQVFYRESKWAGANCPVECKVSDANDKKVWFEAEGEPGPHCYQRGYTADLPAVIIYSTAAEVWNDIIERLKDQLSAVAHELRVAVAAQHPDVAGNIPWWTVRADAKAVFLVQAADARSAEILASGATLTTFDNETDRAHIVLGEIRGRSNMEIIEGDKAFSEGEKKWQM